MYGKNVTVVADDVNARDRVRARLRSLLAAKGMTGRAFGQRLGHGDQWVSNLLSGKFALALEDLDDAARIVGVSPSELVRSMHDESWVVTPSEMRTLRALRALPLVIRDHLMILAEYLMGVTPDEIDLLKQYRQLTDEERERWLHGIELLLLTQRGGPRTGSTPAPLVAHDETRAKGRVPGRAKKPR